MGKGLHRGYSHPSRRSGIRSSHARLRTKENRDRSYQGLFEIVQLVQQLGRTRSLFEQHLMQALAFQLMY